MAFYTADYIKQLIKEDHETVQSHIKVKGNDFRSYIDATIPFALYLDINEIRERVLKPNVPFISNLATLLGMSVNEVIKDLDDAYVKVIDNYFRLPHITTEELENKLNAFSLSIEQGNVKQGLTSIVKRGTVLIDASSKGTRVVVLFPKFNTISMGTEFKKAFNYSKYSDIMDLDTGESPRTLVTKFLNGDDINGKKSGGFGALQNVGHIEVDVISTGSSEVVRGIVSPRLAQALVALPAGTKPEKLTRRFSTETGQADTRLVVRKQFSTSKLVMELLITHGISIGLPESQSSNLSKASKENAFDIGSSITKRIRESKDFLLNLVTSKSIVQYSVETVLSALKGKTITSYNTSTSISKSTSISVPKVKVVPKSKSTNTKLPTVSGQKLFKKLPSLSSLQNLLNRHLQDVISANMGDGNSRNVLNYRTGRLAASAKVEKLTQSKDGMITAFYSAMRNPYYTFSDGGKQQYPRTRDPKLLISKSIKEIALEAAVTRMRAVTI